MEYNYIYYYYFVSSSYKLEFFYERIVLHLTILGE